MVFNSIVFLIYLPLVLCCYWAVFSRRGIKLRNWYLVAVSYIFYGWWDYRFLILILFTSLFSFICGIWIESLYQNSYPAKKARSFARLVNALNIITNLLILFLFKYYNFLYRNLLQKLHFLTRIHFSLTSYYRLGYLSILSRLLVIPLTYIEEI